MKTPLFVEIISCSVETYWYNDHVGKKFAVYEHKDRRYYEVLKFKSDNEFHSVRRTGLIIHKEDCSITFDLTLQSK